MSMRGFMIESDKVVRAMFYGLGADGTVGANKNSIKIIGDDPDFYAQGYFVYDSKKSGSQTVSHLRFGPEPIRSPYLVQSANFIGCHQFNFLNRGDVLKNAAPGAVFLLNTSPHEPEEIWERIPRPVQEEIIAKKLKVYGINAEKVARDNGMGTRINTIMQTCFFAISGVLPRDKAIEKIKYSIKKSYMRKGEEVVRKNFEAVDNTLVNLRPKSPSPAQATSTIELPPTVSANAPEFVRKVTAMMMAGRGDELPVSALPVDGTYPSATTQWEKRNISNFVPVWEPDVCIQCGNCSMVCPHGVIRSKFYNESSLESAPKAFKTAPIDARGFPDIRYTLQVYLEDCTGCALCVEVCPAKSKEQTGRKAINMALKEPVLEDERANIASSRPCPEWIAAGWISPRCAACSSCRAAVRVLRRLRRLRRNPLCQAAVATVRRPHAGGQRHRLLLDLRRQPADHALVGTARARPAWSNSLFEDNAEFGLGFRLPPTSIWPGHTLTELLKALAGAR
jgi:pyruvate-ferredoxin/flavodoxin oxidoreductase